MNNARSAVCLIPCVAITALAAHPAIAQTAAPSVSEIVVTATKRSEQVSKVPISIVAESQQQLDRQGIKTLSDLSTVTPGLLFTAQNVNGAPVLDFSIRGIESRTSSPTTSLYLDDVLLLTIAENNNLGISGASPQVFDLERVEVLRGPQGTLFGNSSEGGSVRFIPVTPSLVDYHAYARGEGSVMNDGQLGGQIGAAVGGPIESGKLGFRASASIERDAGYINRVTPVVGGPGNAGLIEKDANWSTTKTGRLALLYAPNDWLTIETSFYLQEVHSNDTSRYEVAISNPANGDFNNASNSRIPSTDSFWVSELKVAANLGPATLTSITGYYRRHFDFDTDYLPYQDLAFLGSPYIHAPGETAVGAYKVAQHTFSQELRAASNNSQSRISWIAGLYYNQLAQEDLAAVTHDYLKPILDGFGAPPFYQGKYIYFDDVFFSVKQAAVFGNVDYRITDTLKFGVGLREAHTKTTTTNHLEGPFAGGNQVTSGSGSEDSLTPKFTLSWQKDSNNLFYASAGKGYRTGGVNTLTTSTSPSCIAFQQQNNLIVQPTYKPDSLWSYEVGAKNSFFDGKVRTSASAFHIDWKSIQTFAQLQACGFAAIFNLGGARVNGADLDVQAQVTEHLKAGVSFGYIDARYTQTSPGLVLKGDQVGGPGVNGEPAMPPVVLTVSGEYDIPIANDRTIYLWAQDVYHSRNKGPFSGFEPANFLVYDPALVGDPGTNVLNARVGLLAGRVDVSVFANNLLNAHPQLSLSHAFTGDPRNYAYTFRPRMIGLSATFRY